jgi:squalene-associated FAD-dependent desaturase
MKKILIIGAGISGLSSAIFLSKAGYSVEIIEASPKLGGRTYALSYNKIAVDNGQHILMECYSNTLEYIDIIGSREQFEFQDSLCINYVNDKKELSKFKIPKFLYPLNNLMGLMRFKVLKFKDRVAVLKLLIKLKNFNTKNYIDKSVFEFLEEHNQSELVIQKFWESLIVSTMNTSSQIASSKIFIDMMKIVFFSSKRASNIVMPKVDLSSALITPAVDKLISEGVKISTSERALSILTEAGKVAGVQTNNRKIDNFDILISSIPEYALRKIKIDNSNCIFNLPNLEYAPIVTVHVWLNENPLTEKMYNLIGSEFDWVFNHGTHLSFVKSNAKKLVTINRNLVIKIVFSELKKYFTILTIIEIKDYIVIKEMHATFIPNLASVKERKSISNSISNCFLIGDWTDTGLPGTIEGAVKSGKDVIKRIISSN